MRRALLLPIEQRRKPEEGRDWVGHDISRNRREIGAEAALGLEAPAELAGGEAGTEPRDDAAGDIDAAVGSKQPLGSILSEEVFR